MAKQKTRTRKAEAAAPSSQRKIILFVFFAVLLIGGATAGYSWWKNKAHVKSAVILKRQLDQALNKNDFAKANSIGNNLKENFSDTRLTKGLPDLFDEFNKRTIAFLNASKRKKPSLIRDFIKERLEFIEVKEIANQAEDILIMPRIKKEDATGALKMLEALEEAFKEKRISFSRSKIRKLVRRLKARDILTQATDEEKNRHIEKALALYKESTRLNLSEQAKQGQTRLQKILDERARIKKLKKEIDTLHSKGQALRKNKKLLDALDVFTEGLKKVKELPEKDRDLARKPFDTEIKEIGLILAEKKRVNDFAKAKNKTSAFLKKENWKDYKASLKTADKLAKLDSEKYSLDALRDDYKIKFTAWEKIQAEIAAKKKAEEEKKKKEAIRLAKLPKLDELRKYCAIAFESGKLLYKYDMKERIIQAKLADTELYKYPIPQAEIAREKVAANKVMKEAIEVQKPMLKFLAAHPEMTSQVKNYVLKGKRTKTFVPPEKIIDNQEWKELKKSKSKKKKKKTYKN